MALDLLLAMVSSMFEHQNNGWGSSSPFRDHRESLWSLLSLLTGTWCLGVLVSTRCLWKSPREDFMKTNLSSPLSPHPAMAEGGGAGNCEPKAGVTMSSWVCFTKFRPSQDDKHLRRGSSSSTQWCRCWHCDTVQAGSHRYLSHSLTVPTPCTRVEPEKENQKIPLAFSYVMRSNILKEWKAQLQPSF